MSQDSNSWGLGFRVETQNLSNLSCVSGLHFLNGLQNLRAVQGLGLRLRV